MSLRIWLVIYPSITLFLHFTGPALAHLPLYLRTLLLTLVLVPWVVFGGLPLLGLLFRLINPGLKNIQWKASPEKQAT